MGNLPLEDGEEVILVAHRHWIIYTLSAVGLFIAFLLPFISYRLLNLNTVLPLDNDRNYQLAVFFYAAYFLLLWSYFFISWTNTYLDAWIITDRRMVDIEQASLFHRSVTDFRMEKIENVTVNEMGFIANMLGYGSIRVETAGERVELFFDFLPDPYKVRDTINECHSKCLARIEKSGVSEAAHDLLTE